MDTCEQNGQIFVHERNTSVHIDLPLYLSPMPSNLVKSLSLLLFAFVVLLPQQGRGQYALDYGFAVGTANYLGDIGGDNLTRQDFAADLHLNATKISSQVFVRYRISPFYAVKAQIGTVFLEDDDALSTNIPRVSRNVHFKNAINELSLRNEITVFSRPLITRYTSKFRIGVNIYGTLGVTAFTHSPQAQLDREAAQFHFDRGTISTNPNQFNYDRWHNLREYGTEPTTYSKSALAFPLGFGGSFMINYAYRVGIDFVWNLTTTDYIDDVSFTWANPENLTDIGVILSSPTSVEVVSNAGLENAEYAVGNFVFNGITDAPRGNPEKNDTYGTLQLTVSKVVMGSSNFRKNNYYNKRRTVKRKPSRKPGASRMGRGRAKF